MIPRVAKAGNAPLVILASVLGPARASASLAWGPETRVWDFDFENAPFVGLEASPATLLDQRGRAKLALRAYLREGRLLLTERHDHGALFVAGSPCRRSCR